MSLVYAIMDLVGKRLSLSDDQIDKKPPHYQKYWEVAMGLEDAVEQADQDGQKSTKEK